MSRRPQMSGTGENAGERGRMIPYGRQWVDEADVQAVVEVLRSDWLTTGPVVEKFEGKLADFVGGADAVAVANGTAALHAAMHAIGVGPGDEVIVPTMTFVATANAAVFQGSTPVFADVDPQTLLIDPTAVERLITPRSKAVVAVDYAGQPCDYDALRALTDRFKLWLVADASHALGAEYRNRKVGALADLTTFSFHPVKHITTGEGGMVAALDPEMAARARRFRNHGIATDHRQRAERGTFYYEMVELGYNYRLTDLQCALGIKQLEKLPGWLARRTEIARRYDQAFAGEPVITPLAVAPEVKHAYHLYVVLLDLERLRAGRAEIFADLRSEGIGANVHYSPVHLHPFYRRRFETAPGLCPHAESAYERMLSLPMFPAMSDADVESVIAAVRKVCTAHRR